MSRKLSEIPSPSSELLWSRSDHLLSAGSDLLQHFPCKSFRFGNSFDRNPPKCTRITLRELKDNDKFSIRSRVGKEKPRGLTIHSDAFHRATLRGDHDLMRLLLRGNAVKEIDKRDGNMATALHIAVEQGDLTAVKILVEAGSSLSLRDYETPLHTAIRMDHTEIVRYLIRKGASLEITNMERKNAMDLSLRRIQVNDRFAAGILRPITGDDGDTEAARMRLLKERRDKEIARRLNLYSNAKNGKNKNVVTKKQLFEEVRSMDSWDYGKEILFKRKLADDKKKFAQQLGRVVISADLSQARKILNKHPTANMPDTLDANRSPLTYAAMFGQPSTVKWLVQDAGIPPRSQDIEAAGQCKKMKNTSIMSSWHDELKRRSSTVAKQVEQDFKKATILRYQESEAKRALDFLRGLLKEGRARHGKRYRHKLVKSFDALAKCPLGPANDFLELGRIAQTLLPDAWGTKVWASFQKALVASRSKENRSVPNLRQQGSQGEILRFTPGQCRRSKSQKTITTNSAPPPPGRDYRGMPGYHRTRCIDERTGETTYHR